MNALSLGSAILLAFAAADVETARELVHPEAIIYGTDEGEEWYGREDFLESLAPMAGLNLTVTWKDAPRWGEDWVSGIALYRQGAGEPRPVRVTLVFRERLLVLGHFSVADVSGRD